MGVATITTALARTALQGFKNGKLHLEKWVWHVAM